MNKWIICLAITFFLSVYVAKTLAVQPFFAIKQQVNNCIDDMRCIIHCFSRSWSEHNKEERLRVKNAVLRTGIRTFILAGTVGVVIGGRMFFCAQKKLFNENAVAEKSIKKITGPNTLDRIQKRLLDIQESIASLEVCKQSVVGTVREIIQCIHRRKTISKLKETKDDAARDIEIIRKFISQTSRSIAGIENDMKGMHSLEEYREIRQTLNKCKKEIREIAGSLSIASMSLQTNGQFSSL